jgi:ABC-type molybdate transport system permease subunit
MWRKLESGYELVVGVRQNRREVYTPARRVISKMFNLLPRVLFGAPVEDAGSVKLGVREAFELPLISRSVVSAFVLAFALCFDEAVLAYFLAPPGQATLPTQLWLASTENASPAIAAVSTIVMGLVTVLLLAAAWIGRPRPERSAAA